MRVIVFGGTGMLGSMVVRYLVSQGHDVTFTTRERLPRWFPLKQRVSVIRYDVKGNLPDLSGYDWAINCIGAIKQKNVSPYEMYATNAVFPWKLVAACQKANVRLIHVSSDCVFSGKTEHPYLPDSPLDAEDDYGKSKALGEAFGAVVLRTSIIGPAEEAYGLFEWFLNGKSECQGYTNHQWSGVTTLFLSQFIEGLMTKPVLEVPETGGLIQIASLPVTKCQLLQVMNDVFEHDVAITPVEAPEKINRVLVPTVGHAPDIHAQLVMLRDWMKQHGLW